MNGPFDIEPRLHKSIRSAINDTEKKIGKGTVTCTGCGESSEERIEDIYELASWAEAHAVGAWMGNTMYDHHVGFDVDLMLVPELKDLTADITVGDVDEDGG